MRVDVRSSSVLWSGWLYGWVGMGMGWGGRLLDGILLFLLVKIQLLPAWISLVLYMGLLIHNCNHHHRHHHSLVPTEGLVEWLDGIGDIVFSFNRSAITLTLTLALALVWNIAPVGYLWHWPPKPSSRSSISNPEK